MRELSERAIRWLEKRGISGETAAHYGVYTMRRDQGGEVLVFPYLEGGQVVNEKFRAPEKKFWQVEGGKKTFWNHDALLDPSLSRERPNRLTICEGEIDALTAIECGFPLAVSVPDGAPVEAKSEPIDPENDKKFAYVWNCWNDLKPVREIVLAVDDDAPGRALAAELVRRLGVDRCFFVTYPDGCKDLNEVLDKHGPTAVAEVLNGAKPYPVKGLYRLSDFPDAPEPASYSTGWEAVDRHFRLQLGSFVVVTGIPNHGKTAWTVSLVAGMQQRYGWPVALAAFENPPVPYMRGTLRQYYTGKPDAQQSEQERQAADRWIDSSFVFLSQNPDPFDDDDDLDIDRILDLAGTAVVRHGIKVLVLDPWNEIEHKRGRDETETEYTGRAIRALKRFAKRYDVAVIVVAHPIKPPMGKIIKPTLYDISGSANWYNKADVGIVVWRPDLASNFVEIQVKKVRFRSAGRPGVAALLYDESTGRFEESSMQQEMTGLDPPQPAAG